MPLSPLLVEISVMILGVVYNNNSASAALGTDMAEILQKPMKAQSVKPLCLPTEDKLAVTQTDRSKVADAATCWVVRQYRVGFLGRHPHAAARSVLLEMYFIGSPKVDPYITRQPSEFFYISSGAAGLRGRSLAVAYVTGNRIV